MLYITGHCRPANDNRQFPEHCCAMLPVSFRKGKKSLDHSPVNPEQMIISPLQWVKNALALMDCQR